MENIAHNNSFILCYMLTSDKYLNLYDNPNEYTKLIILNYTF